MDALERLPELKEIVEAIYALNPLQRKHLAETLQRQDDAYWKFSADLMHVLSTGFLRTAQDKTRAVKAYNRLCLDLMKERIRFRQTGVYPIQDQQTAVDQVYSQPQVMREYMLGVLLSYLFWENHYRMIRFFADYLDTLPASSPPIRSYLEIAPGHGLFTALAMKKFPSLQVTCVDISRASLELTAEILAAFALQERPLDYVHADFMDVQLPQNAYDLIVMGEIIEHIQDAPAALEKVRRLLASGGTLFMTTCANCPAVDHVYHFHSVCEIRDMIAAGGFAILQEMVMPFEDLPPERWESERVTINYAALLKPIAG